jgi:thioredoxin reductase
VYESHGLDGGEDTLRCDLYLAAMGLRPNTEWLPRECLTDRGYLDVDEFFRVRRGGGAAAAAGDGLFGVGDAVSLLRASIVLTDWHVSGVVPPPSFSGRHGESED